MTENNNRNGVERHGNSRNQKVIICLFNISVCMLNLYIYHVNILSISLSFKHKITEYKKIWMNKLELSLLSSRQCVSVFFCCVCLSARSPYHYASRQRFNNTHSVSHTDYHLWLLLSRHGPAPACRILVYQHPLNYKERGLSIGVTHW